MKVIRLTCILLIATCSEAFLNSQQNQQPQQAENTRSGFSIHSLLKNHPFLAIFHGNKGTSSTTSETSSIPETVSTSQADSTANSGISGFDFQSLLKNHPLLSMLHGNNGGTSGSVSTSSNNGAGIDIHAILMRHPIVSHFHKNKNSGTSTDPACDSENNL